VGSCIAIAVIVISRSSKCREISVVLADDEITVVVDGDGRVESSRLDVFADPCGWQVEGVGFAGPVDPPGRSRACICWDLHIFAPLIRADFNDFACE